MSSVKRTRKKLLRKAKSKYIHKTKPALFSQSRFNVFRNLSRRYQFLLLSLIAALIFTGTFLSGHLSAAVNLMPPVLFGSKSTTLSCNYNGDEIIVDIELYGNLNNYYRVNALKSGAVEDADFARYVYSNSSDKTISNLADDINIAAKYYGLSGDQIVELTACMIQNIPYDQSRSDIALSTGNTSREEQFPYETLYKNSGICTDKTYLGSAILREMGYGTGIFLFPEDDHMALALNVPAGYTSFSSNYTMIELTTPGFVPGQLPDDIDDNNGKPSAVINNLTNLSSDVNPSDVNLENSGAISAPTLIIDVNEGKPYARIVEIKNLENKILSGIDRLKNKLVTLELSYQELQRRDRYQDSRFSYYNSLPSTELDCGYKYDYNYSYSYSYDYSYSSPYRYKCDTVSNTQKSYAYTSYTIALSSFNNQVSYHNGLLGDYNDALSQVKRNLDSYKRYIYN